MGQGANTHIGTAAEGQVTSQDEKVLGYRASQVGEVTSRSGLRKLLRKEAQEDLDVHGRREAAFRGNTRWGVFVRTLVGRD